VSQPSTSATSTPAMVRVRAAIVFDGLRGRL
jgi:hypothetical protein